MNAQTETLLAELTADVAEQRWMAAEAIALIGSWAIHRAAPALLARLEDEHTRVRVTAAPPT